MTRDEALGVLRVLTAAWPKFELTDDTIDVYVEFMRGVSADVGHVTARELIRHSQWFPTVTEFHRHAMSVARRERDKFRALPEPPVDREKGLAHVREIREQLNRRAAS